MRWQTHGLGRERGGANEASASASEGSVSEQGGPRSARSSWKIVWAPVAGAFALRWGRPGSPGADTNTQPHCPAQSRRQDTGSARMTEPRSEGHMGEWVDDGASEGMHGVQRRETPGCRGGGRTIG